MSETEFELCAPDSTGRTEYVPMGNVAGGTVCEDDAIVETEGGSCTPEGELECDDGASFGYFGCAEGEFPIFLFLAWFHGDLERFFTDAFRARGNGVHGRLG